MKLLIDENLSWRLCRRLADLGITAEDVSKHNLKGKPDSAVRAFAAAGGFVLLTRDRGLYEELRDTGPPPRIIRIALISKRERAKTIERLILERAEEIARFLTGSEPSMVLVLSDDAASR